MPSPCCQARCGADPLPGCLQRWDSPGAGTKPRCFCTTLRWASCSLCGCAPPHLAPCALAALRDGASGSLSTGSLKTLGGAAPGAQHELPARTIYRPWFSPYSYFICTAAAPQQHLSSSLATGTQEPEEADRLSETICSSSCSSEGPQPSQRGRQKSSRVSITVRDILAAARGQPVPRHGYKCRACCRVFPTLWAVKTHIQHSFQEGYSCKAYYRKLKVLLEKESQAERPERRSVGSAG
uniref:Spermatogenesis associated 46 n=1 Tax=Cairina moschata TaxID=8855 RepID=A0A8C3CLK3_CAIMO